MDIIETLNPQPFILPRTSNKDIICHTPSTQQTIAAFDWPFHTALDPSNRWVKLGNSLPWDAMINSYNATLSADHGRPAKPARLVIGEKYGVVANI